MSLLVSNPRASIRLVDIGYEQAANNARAADMGTANAGTGPAPWEDARNAWRPSTSVPTCDMCGTKGESGALFHVRDNVTACPACDWGSPIPRPRDGWRLRLLRWLARL